MPIEYLRHPDQVEDALTGSAATLGLALNWAFRTSAPELTDFIAATQHNAERNGNYNGAACEVSTATKVLLDAYFDSKGRAVA